PLTVCTNRAARADRGTDTGPATWPAVCAEFRAAWFGGLAAQARYRRLERRSPALLRRSQRVVSAGAGPAIPRTGRRRTRGGSAHRSWRGAGGGQSVSPRTGGHRWWNARSRDIHGREAGPRFAPWLRPEGRGSAAGSQ